MAEVAHDNCKWKVWNNIRDFLRHQRQVHFAIRRWFFNNQTPATGVATCTEAWFIGGIVIPCKMRTFPDALFHGKGPVAPKTIFVSFGFPG